MSGPGNSTASSGGQLPSRFPTSNGGHTQKVRLAYQVGNRFLSPRSDIDATGRGDTVARQVYHRWIEAAAATMVWYRLQALFWKPVVQIGAVSTLRHIDIETANVPREVFFASREDSPELNAAFRRPEVLQDVESFAESFPDIVTGSMPNKMVVVALTLRKAALFSVVVSALLVSIAVGLVIGLATSSLDAGFACFGGLGLIISLFIGVMFHKS